MCTTLTLLALNFLAGDGLRDALNDPRVKK